MKNRVEIHDRCPFIFFV